MPYVDDGTIELFPETDNIPQYYTMSSVFVLPIENSTSDFGGNG